MTDPTDQGAATDAAPTGEACDAAALEAGGTAPRGLARSRWRSSRWFVRTRRRFALGADTDVDQTVHRITDAIRLDGEAPWMLVCSCLLASIGLDVDSTAVIIGAMLISPLMSPILGIGLATGQADRRLLIDSARELGLATFVSLATSTLYFWISPLGEPTSELVARTAPTLLDVGVAFFGGVAGIIAGSRRHPSLALPGVAIATALMPPLCTAGFGLATGRPAFFFGALYLYVLNAIFISLATFGVVRALGFPLHTMETGRTRRRELQLIAGIASVAVLPSLWFLYTTVQTQREAGRIDRFVRETIADKGHDVLRWDREAKGDSTILKVFIAGPPVTPVELDSVHARRASYALTRLRVQPVQSDVTRGDLTAIRSEVQSGVLQLVSSALAARDSSARVRDSLARGGTPTVDSSRVRMLAIELQRTFPEIQGVAWVPIADLLAPDSLRAPPTLQLSFVEGMRPQARADVVDRANRLARGRFGERAVRVIER